MQTQSDIEVLAYAKLQDAEILLASERFDSAYYLAGYAVELLLKARVCKTLGIPDFFDFDGSTKKKVKNEREVTRPFRSHDLVQLFFLSGIYNDFQKELEDNQLFELHWWSVVKWSEDARYLKGFSSGYVKDFVTSVKEIMVWIQRHL
jgi:hypothetical protein